MNMSQSIAAQVARKNQLKEKEEKEELFNQAFERYQKRRKMKKQEYGGSYE